MDTVVRKKDKKWFRITEINGNMATLAKLFFGEAEPRMKPEVIEMNLADIEKKFEKKKYPKVECYNLNDTKEGGK
jgi:hypothetical protein